MNCVICNSRNKDETKKKTIKYKAFVTPPTPTKKIKNELINIKNDINIKKEK